MTPPRPLRFGVLGTGRITRRVGPAIARTAGAELSAVASRNATRAAAWAAEHGSPRSYGSYAELLDDPDLDALYIALPPTLHREWTIRAAERGLHILCEKPLATTLADAAEMAAACRQHEVQLVDGVMWVHTPRAAMMRSILDDGTLGPLRRVTSAFSFPADWGPNEIRYNPDLGGGSLLDLGWYCIGVTLWAFGALPSSVTGWAALEGGVDRSFSAMLHFEGGQVASFDCGFQTATRRWFEVAGRNGSLVCDDFTRPWTPEKARFWVHGDFGKATEHRSDPVIQDECLVAAFCHLATSGQADHSWADFAVNVQRVCEALLTSSCRGSSVTLNA